MDHTEAGILDLYEIVPTAQNNLTDKTNCGKLVSDSENACQDMIYVKINKVGHCYIISNKWILSSCHRVGM